MSGQQITDGNKPVPCRIYSSYAAEQAAYEILHFWFRQVEKRLAEEPGNVMTGTLIGGHAYWLIDGHLVSSIDAGVEDDPLPEDVANNPFFEENIEGLGVEDILDIANDARSWVNDPTFIRLADDHYMGSGRPQTEWSETRLDQVPAQPDRDYWIYGFYNVVVKDNSVISIDGRPCDIDLDMASKAMIAGSGYVTHITMRVPQIDVVGRPSCFDTLDEASLLTHLCQGTGYSPLCGSVHKATTELATCDDSVELEYQFSLHPIIVHRLECL